MVVDQECYGPLHISCSKEIVNCVGHGEMHSSDKDPAGCVSKFVDFRMNGGRDRVCMYTAVCPVLIYSLLIEC